MVVCPFCGASVTRNPKVVLASRFRDAHLAAFENLPRGSEPIQVCGVVYRKLFQVGAGEHTEVFLAERIAPMTERVVLKIGPVGNPPPAFSSEVTALNALQAINSDDSAYYSTRLPQVIRTGPSERTPGHERHVLVLRHAPGYWGSLDNVRSRYPDGIDARHIVWIWRRILEVLAFVHAHGWTHGNLRPEHFLVQPHDHGIRLCGWSHAVHGSGSTHRRRAGIDLSQSAWAMIEMLGSLHNQPALPAAVPGPLKELLREATGDQGRCEALGAAGIERLLREAARESFGPPQFVPFNV